MSERFGGNPPMLLVAAAVACVEGLLAAVLGAIVGIDALRGAVENRPAAAFMAVFGLVAGVGLVAAARDLYRRRRWARAPIVVTQLILLPVTVAVWQGHQYVLSVVIGVVAIVAGVCAVSRQVAETIDG